jgi:hypothetical protein
MDLADPGQTIASTNPNYQSDSHPQTSVDIRAYRFNARNLHDTSHSTAPTPLAILAELCELDIRQVPKYSSHSEGGFHERVTVCSWPATAIGGLNHSNTG